MFNIISDTPNVNPSFANYIPVKEKHKHFLVNQTIFKAIPISERVLWTLYYLVVKNRDEKNRDEFTVSNTYLAKSIHRSTRTVSRCVKDLEHRDYITKRSVTNSNGKECRTTNYYTINYIKIYEDYGEALFTDLMENMIAFIRKKIRQAKDAIRSLCRTLCLPDKLISKDIDNNNMILLKNAEEEVPIIDPPGDTRTYFNAAIVTCPASWVTIAQEEQLDPIYLAEEFKVHRDYWLSRGRILVAKRSDWDEIWRRRIRDVVNHPMTRYKRVLSEQAQRKQELQDRGKGFTLLPWVAAQRPRKAPQGEKEPSYEPMMPWTKELASDAIMAPCRGFDLTAFTEFYTVKAGHVKDTKLGWLKRCQEWHRAKGDGMRRESVIPEIELDVRLPEQEREINLALFKKLGKAMYVSWVQATPVIKQGGRFVLLAKTKFQADKFKEPHLQDAIRQLDIDIVYPKTMS